MLGFEHLMKCAFIGSRAGNRKQNLQWPWRTCSQHLHALINVAAVPDLHDATAVADEIYRWPCCCRLDEVGSLYKRPIECPSARFANHCVEGAWDGFNGKVAIDRRCDQCAVAHISAAAIFNAVWVVRLARPYLGATLERIAIARFDLFAPRRWHKIEEADGVSKFLRL